MVRTKKISQKKLLPARGENELIARGIAILCVVGVHFLANVPKEWYYQYPNHLITIFFDQFSRLSVPLFVGFAGYGLALKYSKQSFSLFPYLLKRIKAIFPLYFLWSLVYHFIVRWGILWPAPISMEPLWHQLVWGTADYQLYFVPMIFQLYFLFPVLWATVRKFPAAALLGALGIQVATFLLILGAIGNSIHLPFFWSDHHQYWVSTSWIFYFVLGMALGMKEHVVIRKLWWKTSVIGLTISGLLWAIWDGSTAIQSGVDPLTALRFTRWPVLVFATGSTSLFITMPYLTQYLPRQAKTLLSWCGKHSYSIYLSHTLGLRLWFMGYRSILKRF